MPPKSLAKAARTRPPLTPGRIILKLFKWGFLGVLACAAAGAAVLAVLFWIYGSDPSLPRIGALKDYHPKQTTRILAADGTVIGELYEERRTFVTIDKIAPIMVQAAIDAEDADFRTHGGISIIGMARAFWVNLRAGHTRQGASTITQQVVKTFLLTPERSLKRKLQEILLARRLEQALTKDEILTLYLNQIYFGHGRYGIEEASRFYFGKSAIDLNPGEAALLAGLPQSPERLSPLKHPEAAKARQTYVLEQLAKHGHLSDAEAQKYINAPITLVRYTDNLDVAPEYVEIVKKELEKRYGDTLPTAGLTIQTTLDVNLERSARAALEGGLRAIDERHGYRGAIAKLKPNEAADKLAALTKELGPKGPRVGEVYEGLVVSVNDDTKEMVVDLGGWKGAVLLDGPLDERLNPFIKGAKKKPSQRFAKNDVVRVRLALELPRPKTPEATATLALELGPQAALVVIDPATRKVLALIGGYDFAIGGYDRAMRAKRQPGSSFKPILYTAAVDSGAYTAATIVNDAPEVYALWKPKNYEHEGFRGPVRLRLALAHSINTVAIRVMHEVTPERVIALAHDLGIDEDLPKELSLALGSGVVTPIEHINAYATFADEGKLLPPRFIDSIDGVPEPTAEPRQVLRPEVAYVITNMMESVVQEGTGVEAKKLKREIAGKTGTSNSGKDAWFVGYTPDVVCGVWVGFDDSRTIGRGETGAKAALPIWIDVMRAALKGKRDKSFHQPTGVVVARIDKKTGLLAAPGEADADVMQEVFLDGTVPTAVAPAPGEVDPSTFVVDEDGATAGTAAPIPGKTTDDEANAANADPGL